MGFLDSLVSGVGSALTGGLLGGLAGNKQDDINQQYAQDYNQANSNMGLPAWAPEQQPYVFGQGYNFRIPQLSQQAQDYGNYLASGGGAEGPMGVQGLLGSINNGGANGLLGYGAPQPPQFGAMWAQPEQPAQPAQPAQLQGMTPEQLEQLKKLYGGQNQSHQSRFWSALGYPEVGQRMDANPRYQQALNPIEWS